MSVRASEIAAAVFSVGSHLTPVDQPMVEEFAQIKDMIERVDAVIAGDGLVGRSGKVSAAVDLRLRLSGRLDRLCKQLCLSPEARFGVAARVMQGQTLAGALAEVRRRREASRA